MKRILFIIPVLLLLSPTLSAQSKKKIKEKGITEKVSYDYDLKGNKEVKIIRFKEKFDTKGNLIEEFKYNKEGKQLKHFAYKYDKNNDLIMKVSYFNNGKVKKTTIYAYKNGLKVGKITKDDKGNTIEKESYEYSYSK